MTMKLFRAMELREALEWAEAGGIALHFGLHQGTAQARLWCFRNAPTSAHLFCRDSVRLCELAEHWGVRRVSIHYEGTHKQHVDLCGRPLCKAIRAALNPYYGVGRTISRHEALRLAVETLETAERERIEAARAEAERGVQYIEKGQ